ncbi:MAG TPA: SIS domain-containing protein [Steroidobacteraceae bacterium]|nr:SIS domain-containing protein [Steroidobacteraceae bacterium]
MVTQADKPGAALDAASRSQPEAIERLLAEGLDQSAPALQRLAEAQRVWLIGIGTSYHAAAVGSYILRQAGAEAHAVHSFDFVHYPPALRASDALIVFSHRGTKRFSIEGLAAARRDGMPVVAITGEGSKLPDADLTLRTVPQERSAAHSISYTTALVRLTQLATERARRNGVATPLAEALASIPERMRAALRLDERIRELAERVNSARMVHLTGGGPNAQTATEGALKLKEASYVLAEGMAIEQFIHGPIVAVDAVDLGLLVNAPGPSAPRIAQLAAALRGFGTPVISVGSLPDDVDPVHHLALPLGGLPEALTPLVTVVPLQRLALHLGLARGVNPDSYRRDQPIYAAALDEVPL